MVMQASGVEVFSANPGIINTPLNRRKLDHSKFTGWSVDIFTRIYGQKTERAAVCLTRPATDPALAGKHWQTYGTHIEQPGMLAYISPAPPGGWEGGMMGIWGWLVGGHSSRMLANASICGE